MTTMGYIILIGIFFFVLVCLLFVGALYNRAGDVENLIHLPMSMQKNVVLIEGTLYQRIQANYTDPVVIVEKMHELALYNCHAVRWPVYFLLALIASLLLLYVVGRLALWTVIFSTVLIFIFLDLPRRVENAHVYGNQNLMLAFLHARFNELNKPPPPAPEPAAVRQSSRSSKSHRYRSG